MRIDEGLLAQMPLEQVTKVTFYKLDEVTTDLICCEVSVEGKTLTFHEEMEGWEPLLRLLKSLPGFRDDWFAAVFQLAFARCETVAFSRA